MVKKHPSRLEVRILNNLCRSYHDTQKSRVRQDLRLYSVEEDWMANLIREYVSVGDRLKLMQDNWKKRIKMIRVKFGDSKAEKEENRIPHDMLNAGDMEHIRTFREYLEDEVPKKTRQKYMDDKRNEFSGYDAMRTTREMYFRREEEILNEAKKLFDGTELWDYCGRVKGLGPVAGLTFLGYRKK